MSYTAPLRDIRFVLNEICGLADIAAYPEFADATPELVDQILDEAARIAAQEFAPLNQIGDRHGCILENGAVRTPPGFKEAYATYRDGGWGGASFAVEHGGMGLPWTVAHAVQEMWQSANMAFALGPMLTLSAVEALLHHGTDAQQATYLPKLVSGEWMGTMNLTEPQAGSDLARIAARAVPDGDHYRITGQKIFISYGDHDFTPNIVHMVLARTPDAPAGVRGISMFIVPKFIPDAAGEPGQRNDLRCVSLEHKLGIHASPTAVMSYGDGDGAVGYLLGPEHHGLACMFTMMNHARLGVGLQGLAIAERAFQHAAGYARERVQSRALTGDDPAAVAIVNHPGVRRQLLLMRSQTEAMRALNYYAAAQVDRSHHHPDAAQRDAAAARVDLITPVAKAWSTDLGSDVASLGIQVHGGVGYIEETGAAQHFRDARITSIYEGTNGIQANDLLGRKVLRDGGAALTALLDEITQDGADADAPAAITGAVAAAVDHLRHATARLIEQAPQDPEAAYAGAEPFLHLAGVTIAGWLMLRAAAAAETALAADPPDRAFLEAKRASAVFFAEHIMPATAGLAAAATAGNSVLAVPVDEI